MKPLLLLIAVLSLVAECEVYHRETENEGIDFWRQRGLEELEVAKKRIGKIRGVDGEAALKGFRRPKNVVIFIGDGMGLATLTASRIYKSQKKDNVSGEEGSLAWEDFSESAFLKTYNTNKQTGDSAATAMALFTGVKTTYKTLGFDHQAIHKSPSSQDDAEEIISTLDMAQEAGLKTGIVTTARVTHATPAALYAHSANRDWECDSFLYKVKESEADFDMDQIADIARQLIETRPGNNTNVVLGGGFVSFKAKYSPEQSHILDQWTCQRSDGRDLIKEWQEVKGRSGSFVSNKDELQKAATDTSIKNVFGLFADSHMSYEHEKPDGEPTLPEMTEAALQSLIRLDREEENKGFFLMVEGGRIDHAHHDNFARRALDETVALNDAVKKTIEILKDEGILDDTLLIVTADHSHAFTLQGYQTRGNDILGLTGDNVTTMAYANGPGYRPPVCDASVGACETWRPQQNADTTSYDFLFPALYYRDSETHAMEDVPLYADGPYSQLFHKTHEQSYVGHVLHFALCIGPYKDYDHCDSSEDSGSVNAAVVVVVVIVALAILGAIGFAIYRRNTRPARPNVAL